MRCCGGGIVMTMWHEAMAFSTRRSDDDGLNAPVDHRTTVERLRLAREFLARNPILLRPNHGLVEISGL